VFKKLWRAIYLRRYWIRQISVAAVAGAFAWFLGDFVFDATNLDGGYLTYSNSPASIN